MHMKLELLYKYFQIFLTWINTYDVTWLAFLKRCVHKVVQSTNICESIHWCYFTQQLPPHTNTTHIFNHQWSGCSYLRWHHSLCRRIDFSLRSQPLLRAWKYHVKCKRSTTHLARRRPGFAKASVLIKWSDSLHASMCVCIQYIQADQPTTMLGLPQTQATPVISPKTADVGCHEWPPGSWWAASLLVFGRPGKKAHRDNNKKTHTHTEEKMMNNRWAFAFLVYGIVSLRLMCLSLHLSRWTHFFSSSFSFLITSSTCTGPYLYMHNMTCLKSGASSETFMDILQPWSGNTSLRGKGVIHIHFIWIFFSSFFSPLGTLGGPLVVLLQTTQATSSGMGELYRPRIIGYPLPQGRTRA